MHSSKIRLTVGTPVVGTSKYPAAKTCDARQMSAMVGRIAVAEPARLALLRQMRFERFERLQGPMLQPAVARSFVLMHFALEIVADARHDERVSVARDDQRQPANAARPRGSLGSNGGFGADLFQVLDDGERLKQRRAVVDDQCRNHASAD